MQVSGIVSAHGVGLLKRLQRPIELLELKEAQPSVVPHFPILCVHLAWTIRTRRQGNFFNQGRLGDDGYELILDPQ